MIISILKIYSETKANFICSCLDNFMKSHLKNYFYQFQTRKFSAEESWEKKKKRKNNIIQQNNKNYLFYSLMESSVVLFCENIFFVAAGIQISSTPIYYLPLLIGSTDTQEMQMGKGFSSLSWIRRSICCFISYSRQKCRNVSVCVCV